jgi:adenine-specific DNA-methyltransferase
MDKKEIKNILNQKYERTNFQNLTQSIFKKCNYFTTPKIIETNNNKVLNFFQLGNIELADGKNLAIFELKLRKDTNIYKNKVELRNLTTKYIDQVTNHGVFVVFDNQGSDYRLTFSSKYSELDSHGSFKKIETSPKRYTYLLGENESCSTPAERLSILDNNNEIKIEDIIDAFNTEKVTKEFFDKYKNLYFDLAEDIKEFKNSKTKLNQSINEFDFSKKLLGQIIFIYFLQKKGLIGLKKKEDGTFQKWGEGPKDFLRQLFDKKYCKYNNFYDEVLEPLFFEGLSSSRKDDYFYILDCKIPFLNGGLFEKFYNWTSKQTIIKNETILKILDTFDQYNFTIQEEDPQDREVAIDPEMLGKIFESLIEVSERKKEGIYYTPREIVNFMCKSSLLKYLIDELKNKGTELDSESLNNILDKEKDLDLTQINLLKKKKNELNFVYESLNNVKICDPAIGSGAFPVGLLNIISNALKKIIFILEKKNISDYNIKKNIIKNCIYGVDKNSSSVEIAKLRLWLSLIIEEQSLESVDPLPNLDYKIVHGNSIIGVEHNLLNNSLINDFVDLKNQFFNETSPNKIEILKKNIDKIKEELNISNNFDFEINFNEVFNTKFNNGKSGFDIVVANPPYLGEKNNKDIFREARAGKLKNFYQGKMDLFYFFFHQGINILKDNGILCFITTNYFITAQGGRILRKDFFDRCSVDLLINFNELKIFESAQGQHNLITLLRKHPSNNEYLTEIINSNEIGIADNNLLKSIFERKSINSQYQVAQKNSLYDGNEHYLRLTGQGNNNQKNTKNFDKSILLKISEKNFPLTKYCHIMQGIVSAADKLTDRHISKFKIKEKKGSGIFVLTQDELKNLLLNNEEKKIIFPFYKNSQVKKFRLEISKEKKVNYIIYLERNSSLDLYPNIKNHLQKFRKILIARLEQYNEDYSWWCLHRSRDFNLISQKKIVCPRRAKINNFAIENGKYFEQSDIMIISIKNNFKTDILYEYLLGILNSKLLYFWLSNRGKVKGDTLELYGKPLEEIPFKIVDLKIQNKVAEYSKILQIKFDKIIFDKLNSIIYNIYSISENEIKVIEEKYPNSISINN